MLSAQPLDQALGLSPGLPLELAQGESLDLSLELSLEQSLMLLSLELPLMLL